MNYFGLFFSFMLPGILIGLAAMATGAGLSRAKAAKRRVSAMRQPMPAKKQGQKPVQKPVQASPVRGRLFVYSLQEDRAA